jgi:hypothetical protein
MANRTVSFALLLANGLLFLPGPFDAWQNEHIGCLARNTGDNSTAEPISVLQGDFMPFDVPYIQGRIVDDHGAPVGACVSVNSETSLAKAPPFHDEAVPLNQTLVLGSTASERLKQLLLVQRVCVPVLSSLPPIPLQPVGSGMEVDLA